MPVPQITSIPEDALLLSRDAFALRTNRRQLRMHQASIRDDLMPDDNPWLALANMQVGESFTLIDSGESVRWKLQSLGDKAVLHSSRGQKITLDPLSDSNRTRTFVRDLKGLLLARHHGIDAGDLGRAIERDPVMLHRRYVELAVRCHLPLTPAALQDYPELQQAHGSR